MALEQLRDRQVRHYNEHPSLSQNTRWGTYRAAAAAPPNTHALNHQERDAFIDHLLPFFDLTRALGSPPPPRAGAQALGR